MQVRALPSEPRLFTPARACAKRWGGVAIGSTCMKAVGADIWQPLHLTQYAQKQQTEMTHSLPYHTYVVQDIALGGWLG